MLYARIPQTDWQVSRAAVGTMSFGKKVNAEEAALVVGCALENGINMLDTANWYNGGESERILGEILPQYDRSRIIVASKVAYCLKDGKTATDLSYNFIISAVEESLNRMNTDYMDICYFHAPDYDTPLEESLEAMDRLVKDGKVRCFGVSNYAAWQITDMIWRAQNAGFTAPVLTQNVYNMLSRSLDDELKPCLAEKEMGLVIFNPLAGGLLSGKHRMGKPTEGTRFSENRMYFDRYWNEENFMAISSFESIAEDSVMSILELAIRWCLSQEHVTSMLLG